MKLIFEINISSSSMLDQKQFAFFKNAKRAFFQTVDFYLNKKINGDELPNIKFDLDLIFADDLEKETSRLNLIHENLEYLSSDPKAKEEYSKIKELSYLEIIKRATLNNSIDKQTSLQMALFVSNGAP